MMPDSETTARLLIHTLLQEELLELSTPSSRGAVVLSIADALDEVGANPARIAEALEDCDGVAELFASDDELAALLSSAVRG